MHDKHKGVGILASEPHRRVFFFFFLFFLGYFGIINTVITYQFLYLYVSLFHRQCILHKNTVVVQRIYNMFLYC